jgi:hypothetical protein
MLLENTLHDLPTRAPISAQITGSGDFSEGSKPFSAESALVSLGA